MVLVPSVATKKEKLLLVAFLHLPPPQPSAILQTWGAAGGLLEGLWRRKGAGCCLGQSQGDGAKLHMGKSLSKEVSSE